MSKKKPSAKRINSHGVKNAQRLVRQAIQELIDANAAVMMSRQLNKLYEIEDELWQYATALKGE